MPGASDGDVGGLAVVTHVDPSPECLHWAKEQTVAAAVTAGVVVAAGLTLAQGRNACFSHVCHFAGPPLVVEFVEKTGIHLQFGVFVGRERELRNHKLSHQLEFCRFMSRNAHVFGDVLRHFGNTWGRHSRRFWTSSYGPSPYSNPTASCPHLWLAWHTVGRFLFGLWP